VVLVYLGYRGLHFLAGALLDRWWYAELTDAPVWSRRFGARLTLIAVAGVVSLAVMVVSNRRALATDPPEGQKTFRPIALAAARLGPSLSWLAYLLPLWFTALIARAAGGYWQEWLMFTSAEDLDVTTPVVGYDLSFHLFRLPFLSAVTAWLMSLLMVTLIMAWAIFFFRGAVRLPIRGRRSSPRAVAHLSALGAAWLVVRAVDYWFVKYPSLASKPEGRFHGAGWALLHSAGVAYRPLAIAAIAGAVTLLLFAYRRLGPAWPAATLGTVLITHLVVVVALPTLLQRTVVAPAEAERESTYIALNLAATKEAYALAEVGTSTRVLSTDGAASLDTERLPLFDTDQLPAAFQILQGSRGTRVGDVDLDRYDLDGTTQPVAIAVRGLARTELPEHGWVQEHLVYTHGEGAIIAPADDVSEAGVLTFLDPSSDLGLEEPAVYFGEGSPGWYAFTGTKRTEVNGSVFDGTTGVPVGSTWRRLVAALALRDYNVAATSEFTSDTQLLYRRDLRERVHALAPFLALDGDPYPVVVDGRIVWLIDAYTTSTNYPFAQFADRSGLPRATEVGEVNYLRRAALVTVDGYDGSVHFYRTAAGATDPVLQLWDRILPGLFEDISTVPAEVEAHRRFGHDLFTVTTNMLAQYHVDDAEALFSGTDSWIVSPSAGTSAEDPGKGPAAAVTMLAGSEAGADWVSYRTYSPGAAGNPASGRDEMIAIAVGDNDTGQLDLVRLQLDNGEQLTSPRVAQSLIASDSDVSQLFTLLNSNGSKVFFGPMTPILGDRSFAWIRPVFVVGTTGTATPRLHSVLAVVNERVGIGTTAESAVVDALRR